MGFGIGSVAVTAGRRAEAVLDVAGLTVAGLVHGIGFSCAAGERVAMVGASGSGKSLTAKALLGALPPGLGADGSIRIGGVEVRGVPVRRRAAGQRPGSVPQDTSLALHPLVTVGDQVAMPLRAAGRRAGPPRLSPGVVELLEAVGLADPEEIARRRPGQLSGGQRQRVCLAIALASRPPLVIADEPTTALDMITQAAIVRLLRERTGGPDGPALLFITHDLAVAAGLCDRIIVMHDGRIVEDRPTVDVLRAPAHPRTEILIEAARRASAALDVRR